MKRKKMISTAVAGMLVAAQMVMPVAATGKNFDVTVQTITPVIRVEVPTSLTVAVNQFEKNDLGSQIYSTTFGITNKSEVPVKITVTSTATLDSGTALEATKKGAEEATGKKAWLAVAAQVEAGKYVASNTTPPKGIKDLAEDDKNVTTFDTTNKKAVQTFYLAMAQAPATKYTAISGGSDATALAAAKAAAAKVTYAKFYKLTAVTAPTDDAALQTLVDAKDIYGVKSDNTVTFLAKGTAGVKKGDGLTYYELGTEVTDPSDGTSGFKNSEVYVYGEAADGGKTGFRYIGKLGTADGWSSTDLSKINIAYTIAAISQDRYNGIKAACAYGLYNSLLGKTVNGASVMNDAATPVAIATKTSIVSKLKNTSTPNVQFVLTAAQLAVVKAEGLTVKGINIKPTKATDATEEPELIQIATAEMDGSDNPSPVANTDGKVYKLKAAGVEKLTATSVDYIEVLYKTSDDKTMTIKYTF